jgi:hypothetical protein
VPKVKGARGSIPKWEAAGVYPNTETKCCLKVPARKVRSEKVLPIQSMP